MKIAIIGGQGMLGSELLKVFPHATNIPHSVAPVEHMTAAIVDGFETVINCAAYHDVEECEKHPHRAFEVNFIGAHALACACRQADARLVHISTNMVFNGQKWTPYDPTDNPEPLNVYGYSKWMGECAIREQVEKGLYAKIIRLGPIYGHAPCRGKGGRQFVTGVIERAKKHEILSYPIDQTVNPISAADAADYIDFLMETDDQTINHVGSDNTCSWYEFAREILHLADLKTEINPSFTNSLVRRPLNGILRPSLKTCTWQDSLARYFRSRPEGA